MKTNDEAGIGRGEETYRKVIYYRTLVKKITTIPKKKERGEFLECHSNKSVLVGFINYAFQTWEIHLIKSFETSFDWSLRRKKKQPERRRVNDEEFLSRRTSSYMKKSFFSSTPCPKMKSKSEAHKENPKLFLSARAGVLLLSILLYTKYF